MNYRSIIADILYYVMVGLTKVQDFLDDLRDGITKIKSVMVNKMYDLTWYDE